MSLVLGCIADDLSGATDLANTLVRRGMRTVQVIGVPTDIPEDAAAVVVALKSRTVPAADAVAWSLAALDRLRQGGARQVFFKYCSTFDSTDAGNIGPVADALLDGLGADFTIACPAFPANGRHVFQGHLFVGGHLLSESGMRHHPLTPMTDPDLVRVLARQTPHAVGLVPFAAVEQGPSAITAAFAALRRDGVRHAIVDALTDDHLLAIGAACADLVLVTGGSGVAMGLPANFAATGDGSSAADLPGVAGAAAVIAGSCSPATRRQVDHLLRHHAAFAVDADALAGGEDVAARALEWAGARLGPKPLLVYSSAEPGIVRAVQERHGRDAAGAMVEAALARIAVGLVEAGVRRLVVAGGETSGAVVEALGVRRLDIGPEIDPGVPWTLSRDQPRLCLALKSGNFGAADFFTRAFDMLE